MVKRKAEISMDEWLERGVVSSEVNRVNAATAKGGKVPTRCPIVVGVPSEEKVEYVTNIPTDVAGPKSESSEWLWLLLEQSGYERWWLGRHVRG